MQFFKIHKFASVISIWPIWTDLTLLNCKIVDCTSLIIVITSHATHTHINYCNLPHGHLLMMVELSGAQCFVRLTLDYIQIEVAHEFTVCWQLKSTSRNEILLCLKLLAAVIVFVIVARVELFIYRVVGRVLSLSMYICAHYSQPANTTTHEDDMPLQLMSLNDAAHMVLLLIITSHTA